MSQRNNAKNSMCPVVTVMSCKVGGVYSLEYPDGCDNCEMLNWWVAFNTEKECNDTWIKQNQDNIEAVEEYYKKYTI